MSNGLNFKLRGEHFDLAEQEEKGMVLSDSKQDSEKSVIAKQKNNAWKSVEYIEKTKKRWKHIFNFAENHQTVFKKECRDFYKNHPEILKKDKAAELHLSAIFLVLTAGTLIASIQMLHSLSILLKLTSIFTFAAGIITLILGLGGLGTWLSMIISAPSKKGLEPEVFLKKFENDKNLKELWFNKKNGAGIKSGVLYGKDFKTKEKDLEEIKAYCETKKWLEQWSRGDVDNLHWVEWRVLMGIVKKYKPFLTPVENKI